MKNHIYIHQSEKKFETVYTCRSTARISPGTPSFIANICVYIQRNSSCCSDLVSVHAEEPQRPLHMEGDKSCPEHDLTAVYENVSMSCYNFISSILLTDLSRRNMPLTCFILTRHLSRKSLEHIKYPFNNLENLSCVLNARIDA